jgi:hypothetical protein
MRDNLIPKIQLRSDWIVAELDLSPAYIPSVRSPLSPWLDVMDADFSFEKQHLPLIQENHPLWNVLIHDLCLFECLVSSVSEATSFFRLIKETFARTTIMPLPRRRVSAPVTPCVEG